MRKNENLKRLVKEYNDYKDDIDLAKTELDEIKSQIHKELQDNGRKSFEDLDSGRATIIQYKPKTVYDWAAIQQAVSPEVWDAITIRTPSEQLLENAVAQGLISVDTLAECSEIEDPREDGIRISKPRERG